MKKTLIARIVGVAMALSVGLGSTQPAEAATSSPTPTTSITYASTVPDDAHMRRTASIVTASTSARSHVSALAIKLGLKEETLCDALIAVSERERVAANSHACGFMSARPTSRGGRQAAVGRALADELRIDFRTVLSSLTELQAELTVRP